MRLDEAKVIAPDIVMVESDPPKYHMPIKISRDHAVILT